jgi:uncharacterized protein (DUF4415 family)
MATRRALDEYHYMAETMRTLELHLHGHIAETGRIPPEWHKIGRQRGVQGKVKVTFWVEADVVKFFKGMGQGWSTRMAEVLRTFMHARFAGVVKGAGDVDYTIMDADARRHRMGVLHELIALRKMEGAEGKSSSCAGLKPGLRLWPLTGWPVARGVDDTQDGEGGVVCRQHVGDDAG